MPLSQDPSKKGDLVIEFEIEFPTSLSPERKDLIKRALLQWSKNYHHAFVKL